MTGRMRVSGHPERRAQHVAKDLRIPAAIPGAQRAARGLRPGRDAMRRPGFTLWEMALVLLVMAIATALAIPAYTRLGAADDADARPVDELLRLLRASRRAAVTHGVTVTLVVDPATGRYRADSAGATGAGPLAEGTLALGADGALDTEQPRLRWVFRATGAALADTVRVRDPRSAGGSLLVRVDAWSGEADAR